MLGYGVFGKVYKGFHCKEVKDDQYVYGEPVAIKKLDMSKDKGKE